MSLTQPGIGISLRTCEAELMNDQMEEALFYGDPFVGFPGPGNSIRIRRSADRLVCELTQSARIYVLLMTTLFGPVASVLLLIEPGWMFDDPPTSWLVGLFVALLNLVAWAVFLKTLLVSPRFEALRGSGDIIFFKKRRGGMYFKLDRREVETFAINESNYLVKNRNYVRLRVPNYLLIVTTKGGDQIDLCISTEKSLISTLMNDLVEITGVDQAIE